MTQLRVVGQSLPRVDGVAKATGSLVYGADFRLPGMLHTKILRSPLASARILHVDCERAGRVPGVRCVIAGPAETHPFGSYIRDEPVLAGDRVRYQGEGIVAVAAEDADVAIEALELVRVEYEPLSVVHDYREALSEGSALLHSGLDEYERIGGIYPRPHTNICHHFKLRKGDVQEGFARADRIFEHTYSLDMMQHAPIEPHVALAQADAQGRITIWSVTQGPWECRNSLMESLGLRPGQVRIIGLPVGGAFGAKIYPRIEPVLGLLAQRAGGRPVRLLFTREEEFTSAVVRQPTTIRIRTGVTRDGRLVAREIEGYYDAGAYADCTPNVCRNGTYQGAGPYRIPHVKADGYAVYTNNPISGALRGYGVPEAAWAYESQMDVIARELGMDPVEIRLRNAWEVGDETSTGEVLRGSVGLRETIHRTVQGIGWGEPLAPPSRPGRLRGRGLACIYKHSRAPTTSSAFLKLHEDGALEILTSTVEFGQGSHTILSQIASEVLGVPMGQVHVATPDTDITPFDMFTSSSRTTFHMGNAVRMAAEEVRRQVVAMAGEVFEAPEELIRFADGQLSVPGREPLTLRNLIRRYYGAAASVVGSATYAVRDAVPMDPETAQTPKAAAFWMYATQAVEVEVDPATGLVELVKVVAAHDVGRAINPQSCEQQIEGALAMGLGSALTEQMLLKDGRVLNPSFLDYRIFTALDMSSDVRPYLVESAHDEGPYGAKGVGEPGLAPTAAALGNALAHAIGVPFFHLPLTAERVRQVIARQSPPPLEEGRP